jgi:hypothetical protein
MDASDAAATRLVGSTVRVFDVPAQRQVSELSLAAEGGISALTLSPDGSWLATQSPAETSSLIRLWPLWREVIRAEACRRLSRNLSPSEWATFIGGEHRLTCPGLSIESE